jgi:hypothetical protein
VWTDLYAGTLNLDHMRDVRRISDADGFHQLVLPEYHKEMIRALVKQHFQDKQTGLTNPEDEQIDLVRGKGQSRPTLSRLYCC